MGDRSVFDRNVSSPSSPSSADVIPSFKVVLLGDVGVGKTTLFLRARHTASQNTKVQLTTSSIGLDSCTRIMSTRSGSVSLTLWDTAGVERFRTLTRNYYRNTHAALLVFSVDDPASLFYLPRWEKDVGESAPDAARFLVGNKSDLERVVTAGSMQNFGSAHNCQAAFLTSAKTGEGVEEALTAICEHLVQKYQHRTEKADEDRRWQEGSGIYVHGADNDKNETYKCCG